MYNPNQGSNKNIFLTKNMTLQLFLKWESAICGNTMDQEKLDKLYHQQNDHPQIKSFPSFLLPKYHKVNNNYPLTKKHPLFLNFHKDFYVFVQGCNNMGKNQNYVQ